VIVPSMQIKKKLVSGNNVIEFTPQDQDVPFSCWMGMIKGMIKVVDDVNAVDIMKNTTAIPAGSGCCSSGSSSCCGSQSQNSIYGDDISKIPTGKIIHKATLQSTLQTIHLKGIGFEFEPLVVVLDRQTAARITFDLTDFDDPEGTWDIVDYQEEKVISSFKGRKGIVEVDFSATSPNTFGIYKNRKITSIIEVVEDLKTTDVEKIRAKFL
jgi:plastocyanin domain-containing protein